MTYEPKAIDTSDVVLSKGLRRLIEKLAENNHEIWARQRKKEGWDFGPERDDERKTHPDLVPYRALPESEKEYDRITAIEALKAIISLGYSIELRSKKPPSESVFPHRVVKDAAKRLKKAKRPDFEDLLVIWESISKVHWTDTSRIHKKLGELILDKGAPLMAYDIVSEGLNRWPNNARLRQLLALALAQSGAVQQANEILFKLHQERKKRSGKADGETLGILARTHKDLSATATDPKEKKEHLDIANGYYYEAYQQAILEQNKGWLDDAIYNGVNAASTAMLLGQVSQAKAIARKVVEICLKKLKRKKDDYWALASIAESAIILEDLNDAEAKYLQSVEAVRGDYRRVSTTRRQARRLLEHMKLDKHRFDHCFYVPDVVIFSGPGIDQKAGSQFPRGIERKLRNQIAAKLAEIDARIVYASAGCNADILFLEEMLKREDGIEINVVLPLLRDEIEKPSVGTIMNRRLRKRLKHILSRKDRVRIAAEYRTTDDPVVYEYSNIVLNGLSILRAKMLDTDVIPILLAHNGQGGTASFVKYWRSRGLEPEMIYMSEPWAGASHVEVKSGAGSEQARNHGSGEGFGSEVPQQVRAMLFGDVVGYGGLPEKSIPNFVKHFLGTVAGLMQTSPDKPQVRNTWGDALYFGFSSVKHAGRFALELQDLLGSANWESKGLPKDLNLRIALHAGPVYRCKDPVLGRYKFRGSHVTRTARIEPITPPGEVYASQEFAALAAAQNIKDFAFEYVGMTPLQKESLAIPLYRLCRPPL